LGTAVAFGRTGFEVYATTRHPERAPELAAMARSEKLPIKIRAIDVDEDRSVNEAVEKILNETGRIDALVNNAGIHASGAVEEFRWPISAALWRRTISACCAVCKQFCPGCAGGGTAISSTYHRSEAGLRACRKGLIRVDPGSTSVTRIPKGFTSGASTSVIASNADFDAGDADL
jgi:NAD(P)-dependent dehydrogenase (short-subunit alcohol dehydrogenase family)